MFKKKEKTPEEIEAKELRKKEKEEKKRLKKEKKDKKRQANDTDDESKSQTPSKQSSVFSKLLRKKKKKEEKKGSEFSEHMGDDHSDNESSFVTSSSNVSENEESESDMSESEFSESESEFSESSSTSSSHNHNDDSDYPSKKKKKEKKSKNILKNLIKRKKKSSTPVSSDSEKETEDVSSNETKSPRQPSPQQTQPQQPQQPQQAPREKLFQYPEVNWKQVDETLAVAGEIGRTILQARSEACPFELAIKRIQLSESLHPYASNLAIIICKYYFSLQKSEDLLPVLSCVVRNSSSYPKITSKFNELWIIQPFCPLGSLSDFLVKGKRSPVSEGFAAHVALICLRGLRILHSAQLPHGSLTPQKLLLTDKKIVLTQYSIYPIFERYRMEKSESQDGSDDEDDDDEDGFEEVPTAWRAPELRRIYDEEDVDMRHMRRRSADIWALGCTVGFLLMGNVDHLFGNGGTPSSRRISDNARDFLQSCLLRDPRQRPSVEALLTHPFIVSAEDRIESLIGSMSHNNAEPSDFYRLPVRTPKPSTPAQETASETEPENFANRHSHIPSTQTACACVACSVM
jgi:serine/threonine protein kinase